MCIDAFVGKLREIDMAENTVKAYAQGVSFFFNEYDEVNKSNIESWKKKLLKTNAETTVNLRVNAINKYVKLMDLDVPHCENIREQKKTYVENVISLPDYQYFKKRLHVDGKMTLYFAIWFMCSSGARVS